VKLKTEDILAIGALGGAIYLLNSMNQKSLREIETKYQAKQLALQQEVDQLALQQEVDQNILTSESNALLLAQISEQKPIALKTYLDLGYARKNIAMDNQTAHNHNTNILASVDMITQLIDKEWKIDPSTYSPTYNIIMSNLSGEEQSIINDQSWVFKGKFMNDMGGMRGLENLYVTHREDGLIYNRAGTGAGALTSSWGMAGTPDYTRLMKFLKNDIHISYFNNMEPNKVNKILRQISQALNRVQPLEEALRIAATEPGGGHPNHFGTTTQVQWAKNLKDNRFAWANKMRALQWKVVTLSSDRSGTKGTGTSLLPPVSQNINDILNMYSLDSTPELKTLLHEALP
jgi:hypothetical protein